MNKTLYLLFNHRLTTEQIEDAEKSLGVTDIRYIPERLQKVWSNIPPNKELNLEKHLQPIIDYLENIDSPNEYILIQGDFGAVHFMVKQAFYLGFIPIYATTERKTIEEKLTDNTIITKRIFKHVCFRKYT